MTQKTERFKPVEEMARQKVVDQIAILYAAFALLQVVDPVATGVLSLGREGGVDGLLVNI